MVQIRPLELGQDDLLRPTPNALALIAKLKAPHLDRESYVAALAQLQAEAMTQGKMLLAAWLEGLRGGTLGFQHGKPVSPKRQIDRDNLVMPGGDAEAAGDEHGEVGAK